MRFRKLRSLLLLALLSLPLLGYSFDADSALRALGLALLTALAGLAVLIGMLIATSKLLQQLGQPEATAPAQQRAAGWRIAGLTLPATVVAWGLVAWAWLTNDLGGSWYYPAVPLTLLLGLAGCLLLRWRQRPMAAKALLAGLLVAGAVATAAWWLARPAPMPLGLLGNPAFTEAPLALATTAGTGAADTSHVYTHVAGRAFGATARC